MNIHILTDWWKKGLAFENKVLISGEILKIFTIFLSLIDQTVVSVVFSLSIFWEEICISQEISISFVNVFDHCFESNVRNKKQEHRCVNDYVESTKKNVWDILLKNHGLKIMWNHKIDRLIENWLGFENKVLISGVILEMVKSFVFSFMFSTVLINVFF